MNRAEPGKGGPSFLPGTLLQIAARQSEHARQTHALEPFATTEQYVLDGGVRFVVRRAESLARKAAHSRNSSGVAAAPANPFIDYDPNLFVADISATHICLLNKFPVMANHLLIVTRTMESQEDVLTCEDFEALCKCLADLDGLGFYNGGRLAGASQPHKHLQVVPLPLAGEGPPLPTEPAIAAARPGGGVDAVPGLPFHHALTWLEPKLFDQPSVAAATAHLAYREMLGALFAAESSPHGGRRQPGPYNLLVTRRWMLLVPRSAEKFASIPVNALGCAGSFFIWSDDQWDALRTHGPMAILAAVAVRRAQRSSA